MKTFIKYLVCFGLLGCLFLQSSKAQQSISLNKIKSWEYWFDNDFSGRVITAVSPHVIQYHLQSNIPANSLGYGLHLFHVRFKDLNGKYSAINSSFFIKSAPVANVNAKLVAYDYWFDNNFAGKVTTSISSTKQFHLVNGFSTAGLSDGLHIFNVRFKDNQGAYSSVTSSFFLKNGTEVTVNAVMANYEYWFDNDYANRVSANLNGQQQAHLATNIDASGLLAGLHLLNIRVEDDQGRWSSVYSRFFLKNEVYPDIHNSIIAYQYWVDSMSNQLNTVWLPTPVKQYRLNIPLDLSQIWHGSHNLFIRFADSLGQWSSIYNKVFYKDTLTIAAFSISSDTICLGSYISFANQSVDVDTYHWDFGDGGQSKDSLPADHLYTTPGLFTITLTATDTISGDDSTISHQIYVSEQPPSQLMVVGNNNICPGDSLIISSGGNATWQWNTGDSSQYIWVKTAGNYYATVTNTFPPFCSVYSDTVVVSILPTYTLSDSAIICAGDSLQLPDGSFASATGLYISNLSTQAGCDSVINTDIIVNQIDTSVNLQNDSLWASLTGATYQWLDCDQSFAPITGAVNQGFKPTVNGHYAVQITIDGCTDTSSCYAANPVGLNVFGNSAISIFPNPTSGLLNIELHAVYNETRIVMRSITGQVVSEKTYSGVSNIEIMIPGAHGMYFIEVYTDHKQAVNFIVSKN